MAAQLALRQPHEVEEAFFQRCRDIWPANIIDTGTTLIHPLDMWVQFTNGPAERFSRAKQDELTQIIVNRLRIEEIPDNRIQFLIQRQLAIIETFRAMVNNNAYHVPEQQEWYDHTLIVGIQELPINMHIPGCHIRGRLMNLKIQHIGFYHPTAQFNPPNAEALFTDRILDEANTSVLISNNNYEPISYDMFMALLNDTRTNVEHIRLMAAGPYLLGIYGQEEVVQEVPLDLHVDMQIDRERDEVEVMEQDGDDDDNQLNLQDNRMEHDGPEFVDPNQNYPGYNLGEGNGQFAHKNEGNVPVGGHEQANVVNGHRENIDPMNQDNGPMGDDDQRDDDFENANEHLGNNEPRIVDFENADEPMGDPEQPQNPEHGLAVPPNEERVIVDVDVPVAAPNQGANNAQAQQQIQTIFCILMSFYDAYNRHEYLRVCYNCGEGFATNAQLFAHIVNTEHVGVFKLDSMQTAVAEATGDFAGASCIGKRVKKSKLEYHVQIRKNNRTKYFYYPVTDIPTHLVAEFESDILLRGPVQPVETIRSDQETLKSAVGEIRNKRSIVPERRVAFATDAINQIRFLFLREDGFITCWRNQKIEDGMSSDLTLLMREYHLDDAYLNVPGESINFEPNQ